MMKYFKFFFILLLLSVVVSITFCGKEEKSSIKETGRGVRVKPKVEGNKIFSMYKESHALVIGASDYQKGWPSLPGVKKDIQSVSNSLKKHGFLVKEIINPSRSDFDQAVRNFISDHGQAPNNRLILYFAGHGHTIKTFDGRELGYIVPVDAPLPGKNTGPFKKNAISMTAIETYALQIESKHALFLFDSCFSGSLFEITRSVPDVISEKTSQPVRQFITSGTAEQRVPDRSIFSEQLVEALEGDGDLNNDGYITGMELGQFLEDKVTNYSNRAQTPRHGKIRNPKLDKGDFVFKVPGSLVAGKIEVQDSTSQVISKVDKTALDLEFWRSIKNSKNPEDFEDYINNYPNGNFTSIAQRRLNTLLEEKARELDYKKYFEQAKYNYQKARYEEALKNLNLARNIKDSSELTNLEKQIPKKGVLHYSNGKYDGYILNGKKHGKGTYFWTNGVIYVGNYEHNHPTGGWYHFKDGTKEWCYKNNKNEWVTKCNSINKKSLEGYRVVKVYNSKELINAIKSNTHIFLQEKEYNITNNEINLKNLTNVTISSENMALISTDDPDACVMEFRNCKKIKLNNIMFGHNKKATGCNAGVLFFLNSEYIEIYKTVLFGSGIDGITLRNVKHLQFVDSKIYKCTFGLLSIWDSSEIFFINSTFSDTGEFNLINIGSSSNKIVFSSCTIEKNWTIYNLASFLFNIEANCTEIYLKNSRIIDNRVNKFINLRNKLTLIHNSFSGNSFTDYSDQELVSTQ